MTHTYATLEVSPTTYAEVRDKLAVAGYEHAFHREDGREHPVIDMHGIALALEAFVVRVIGSAQDEPALVDTRTLRVVANQTPDWVILRVLASGPERVYEMRAADEAGRVYAASYGMTHVEEQARILSGVNPIKHFTTIDVLARAVGKTSQVRTDG